MSAPLPDLSKWHKVPDNAVIPQNTQFIVLWEGDGWRSEQSSIDMGRESREDAFGDGEVAVTYYTEREIPDPEEDLPAEPGTWIRGKFLNQSSTILVGLTSEGGWIGVDEANYRPIMIAEGLANMIYDWVEVEIVEPSTETSINDSFLNFLECASIQPKGRI